jgi:hypothetical protein
MLHMFAINKMVSNITTYECTFFPQKFEDKYLPGTFQENVLHIKFSDSDLSCLLLVLPT